MRLYAACVYHAHGFGCIGVAETEAEAQSYIEGWMEDFPDSVDDDQFDISQVEYDPSAAVLDSWKIPQRPPG